MKWVLSAEARDNATYGGSAARMSRTHQDARVGVPGMLRTGKSARSAARHDYRQCATDASVKRGVTRQLQTTKRHRLACFEMFAARVLGPNENETITSSVVESSKKPYLFQVFPSFSWGVFFRFFPAAAAGEAL
ncbi:MAG: hypothetical protein ACE5E5_11905 [Phycisphaerae bacterium]